MNKNTVRTLICDLVKKFASMVGFRGVARSFDNRFFRTERLRFALFSTFLFLSVQEHRSGCLSNPTKSEVFKSGELHSVFKSMTSVE
jgi:hypothetical protein